MMLDSALRQRDISVIVCAYTEERWDALVAAIESVERQTLAPREIVLVIDHNPRLEERARARFPGVRVYPNAGAQGLAGARNTGIRVAAGVILAFLDDDAAADDDWLEWLARGYAGPSVLGVGGSISPRWISGRPRWFPEEFQWVVGCSYRGLPTTSAPVRNMIGANMSLRREVFETVGGFRVELARVGGRPFGVEETELCIRARQRWPEGEILYEPRAHVEHRVPSSRSTFSYFRRHCFNEGFAKRLLTGFVGSQDGLAAERAYTMRTLPAGVLAGLRESVTRFRPWGALRAAAIIAGLGFTGLGYLAGSGAAPRLTCDASPTAAKPAAGVRQGVGASRTETPL